MCTDCVKLRTALISILPYAERDVAEQADIEDVNSDEIKLARENIALAQSLV